MIKLNIRRFRKKCFENCINKIEMYYIMENLNRIFFKEFINRGENCMFKVNIV